MDRTGYAISLCLSNFRGIEVEEREIDGRMQAVCVIPMHQNGIHYSARSERRGIVLNAKMFPVKPNTYKHSHFIMVSPTQDVRDEREALGLPPCIIIGNAYYGFAQKQAPKPLTDNKVNELLNLKD